MLFMQDLHRQKEWQKKMNNIVIEKMTFEDINAVLSLEKSHNIHILSRRIIEDEVYAPNHYYIVAKINGKIVGYAGMSFVIDIADLLSIVVDSSYTRQKIASLMLENIFNYCKENGICEMLLEVRASNVVAQNLYKKYNFEEISVRKKYYDNIEDAIIMKKVAF